MNSYSKRQLRRSMRQRRRKLSPAHARNASRQILSHLSRDQYLLRADRVALYMANDGEIDPGDLLQDALQRKVACYLPVLQPLRRGHLHFVRYRGQERMRRNRFGIAEPRLKPGNIADPWTLDIIFLPLVAFDREGNRLGMGGGYYDRTLASLRQRTRRRPRLIGLAYSSQEVPSLTPSPWDVGMDAVVTEKALIRFERSPTN
ncbi:MAG TPA: 5-formyltetrahydrofolate cyclo-ligase [Porticoccaceae bacterium]|jgi:5-formyltetrahydrofolate cyclo-ligase|nr:5-formyltetrahydrofolate cyclo-ligase [Porticoccaceae bacterium]